MTETNNRLPIRFVYGNMPIDWEQLEQALKQYSDKFEQKCYLLYDTVYANSSGMYLVWVIGIESISVDNNRFVFVNAENCSPKYGVRKVFFQT